MNTLGQDHHLGLRLVSSQWGPKSSWLSQVAQRNPNFCLLFLHCWRKLTLPLCMYLQGPSVHLGAGIASPAGCAGRVGEEEVLIPPSLSPSLKNSSGYRIPERNFPGGRGSPHSPLKGGISSGAHNPGVLSLPLSWFLSPSEPMICIIGKLRTRHALKTLRLPLAFSRL